MTERDTKRRQRRLRLRALVRDYILEDFDAHKDSEPDDRKQRVERRLRDDFGFSPLILVIIKILIQLLPVFIDLFAAEESDPDTTEKGSKR